MRTPISWLRDFLPDMPPVDDTAKSLTVAGIEVEAIEAIGAYSPKVVIGEVVENQSIQEGKPIRKVIVDIGTKLQVVSGAPNLANASPGTKLAVALPGAKIFDASESGYHIQEVSESTLYGVSSQAVFCSERELGTGPDHTGVLTLGPKAKVGQSILTELSPSIHWTADQVLVLAILPNIARCQSMIGSAREIAALTNVKGNFQQELSRHAITTGKINPKIDAPDLCPRFSTATVEGIRITKSPDYIERRLALSGLDPINNVVDALNYTMLEMGQPMHAYDLDKLNGPLLTARLSKKGESLRTITQQPDSPPLTLPDNLLIIDSGGTPVSVAGVIGSLETSITDETVRIQIEAANFDFIAIRRSQSNLKIHTEASARYSRGVDPTLTIPAIRRALKLLEETCPDLRVAATGDTSYLQDEIFRIDLSLDEVNQSLGTDLTLEEITGLLQRVDIDCSVDAKAQSLQAKVTYARNDLRLPCDLIEEIARLNGYDVLPETMPIEPIPMHPRNRHLEVRESARDAMVRWGAQEIISYTLTSPEMESRLLAGQSTAFVEPQYVKVMNPISPERAAMRRTLLPGILQAVHNNLRYTDACHLFEIGVVVLPEEKSGTPGLPGEPYRLAFALTGPIDETSTHREKRQDVDFYDGADLVRFLLDHLQIRGLDLDIPQAAPAPYHPKICAELSINEKVIGYFGELHPLAARAFDLEGRRILCGELDLETLISRSVRFFPIQEPPRFPSIELDISVVVSREIPVKRLLSLIQEVSDELIQGISIFDVYIGNQIPEGSKAVGIRFNLNAGNRTLKMDEAIAAREKIAAYLREKAGASIRE
jgi:phenylalanyl-tRNA synthetase beta chain